MAEALYRKYRPQTFEDVVGQEHIERTLRNAIQTDKVSHAYLFTGPRGTGKTTTARLLAKALLCEKGPTPDPDGTCEDCNLIAVGEHPDVYELDAASRTGVENVREEIIGRVNYAPTRGRYKVYIIDEVHMLSVAAFNALLKTLEEPPDHVVFILCTTDPQKVPETIQSRCQRFDFRRISSEELISRLGAICEMEGVEFEGDALDLIAHRAQGGMRDALTSLEQLITFSNGSVTSLEAERLLGALDSSELADIVRAIGTRDVAACFKWTSEYVETGADLAQITKDLAEHVRDMYVMSLAGADVALEVTEAGRRELEAELAWFGSDRLARLLCVLGDLISELKTSTNQRLSFEIALTRMVRPESDITLDSLAERLEALERGASSPVIPAQAEMRSSGASLPDAKPVSSAPSAEDALKQRSDASSAQGAKQRQGNDDRPLEGNSGLSRPKAQAAIKDNTQPSVPDHGQSVHGVQGIQESAASTGSTARRADLSGRDIGQVWDDILTNLKKQNEAYGVLFMNTFISAIDGGNKLLIEFSSGNKFAFNAAKKPEAREALERALSSIGLNGLPYEIAQSNRASESPIVRNSASTANVANTTNAAASSTAATRASQPMSSWQDASQGQPYETAQPPREQQDAISSQGQPAPGGTASPVPDIPEDDFDSGFAPDDYLPREAFEDIPSASNSGEQTDAQGNAAAEERSSIGSDEPTMSEISDNLASMFGEGVVLEEIE